MANTQTASIMTLKNKYVVIPIEEYESMKGTIELLSDPELMAQLVESKNSKRIPWAKVKKELGL